MKTPEHIYQPACARCRDEAGKDRAGVVDTSLCNWHTNDLVLSLRAEVERLRAERDGAFTRYDALLWQIANEGCVSARVGEGTRECGLPVCGLCRLVNDRDFYRENSAALGHALEIGNAKIEDLRALLLEVAEGGVEFEDPRVRYVAVQIDADTWARVKALSATAEEEGREERGKEKGK